MENKTLQKKQALSYGWESFKKFPALLIGVTIFSIAVSFVGNSISVGVAKFSLTAGFLFFAGLFIIGMIIQAGLIKVALDIVKRSSSSFAELFSGVHYVVNYIVAFILYGLVVLAGLLLLIVPGIIWSIKFQFYSYFIVEKDKGPIEALKESSRITSGHKGNILLLDILVMLLNLAGSLALGIGMLVTAPITLVAMAHAYKQLEEPQDSSIDSATRDAKEDVEPAPASENEENSIEQD